MMFIIQIKYSRITVVLEKIKSDSNLCCLYRNSGLLNKHEEL